MSRNRNVDQRRPATGFTLAEVLVALTISAVVLMGVYRMMTAQSRSYAQQTASGDVNESARGAGALLGWELRHASMAGDTLMSIAASSMSVRSVQGVGIVCAKGPNKRYGIWKNGGDIGGTSDDSVMIYQPLASKWKRLRIAAVGTAVSMSMPACVWAGVRVPDLVMELEVLTSADTASIIVGSTVRAYRRVQYKAWQDPATTGRWWLGRQVGNAGTWEKVTGPLVAPTGCASSSTDYPNCGLKFTYYDSAGSVTAIPRNVRSVGYNLRTESYKQYIGPDQKMQYRRDSLFARAMLRP